ncbi:LysR family glycine cleavage system transcriptional activator [Novosphingobium chloroacetimidivorans]|uniref:LysR family glycine cleavage system transcriptional activator n=1 Tax=Novosphingobium chloroacetimidivorans TaxID=1428314 RepID=A0A7W7NX96_9SPHN|nr:LysR family transcriptional regulator [Novosphingobium chloroacetimidivorans]MBB4858965.1 LysR family glycine cleavage system transcriptional activator [Novosphingobium chloroacetimidivorans]
MKRTHLPLNALRVFDAAARHLSFTRAADELAVTPAAVGQQIRALEDVLGVVLFRRTSKGLELTEEAGAGLEALRSGFLHFEGAVQAMQAGQSSHVYTIAAPREFFAAWLAPRLAAFRKDNPQVRFIIVDGEMTDFTEANLDLAVRWTEGPGDLEGVALGAAEQVVVGTGDWIGWPGDINPGDDTEAPAIVVGDAGQAMSAAISGLGRARVPLLLAQEMQQTGRIGALDAPEPARRGYWLVAPAPQWRQKKVRALVAALTGEG